MKNHVKVAVVQNCPVFLNKSKTFEKLKALLHECRHKKVELAVFPEAFIGGYPKGSDFGVRVGVRKDVGREEFARYFDNALQESDLEVIGKMVKEAKLYLVIGTIEQVGASLFCTAFYFSPDGLCVGRHRKLMPTAAERYIWSNGDGSTMPVIQSPFGKFAAAICWENYMPLFRYYYYSQGIQLYCAPTVDDRDSWIPTMRHIALEGRCFVLSACQYFPKSALPKDTIHSDFDKDPLLRGGSCIISPLGRFIVEPSYGSEVILTADLDTQLLAQGKFDLDVAGHYARPDVFSLHVDTAEKLAVRKTKLS